MKKRAMITVGLGAALIVAPAAAEAQPLITARALCGSNCGTLGATGTGLVRQQGLGVTWGDGISGTIAVRDLSHNNRRDFSVAGFRSSRVDGDTHYYTGRDMRFMASTRWWVLVRGGGISVNTVATGQAHVRGSGRYHLNGGGARRWPQAGRTYTLRN